MDNHQISNILVFIRSRSLADTETGGDGFVTSKDLEFDVGLNTKTVQRELDRLVAAGALEHKQLAPRQPHYYRYRA